LEYKGVGHSVTRCTRDKYESKRSIDVRDRQSDRVVKSNYIYTTSEHSNL